MQNANLVIIALLMIYGLAGWMARARTTGPLVLDISRKVDRILHVLMCLSALVIASQIWRDPQVMWREPGSLWTSFLVYLFMLLTFRQEIRRDGFIRGGRLIRWSRIASWNWEDSPEIWGNNKVLVLHLNRRIQFLPPARIPVQASQKNQVEAILARQLGEWPANTLPAAASRDKMPVVPSSAPSFVHVWGWKIAMLSILPVLVWSYTVYPPAGSRKAPAVPQELLRPVGPDDPPARAASDAVTQFHAAISEGRYADACQVALPGTFLSCPEFLASVHDQIGAVEYAERTGFSGRSDDKQVEVTLKFATHYAHGGSHETFIWLIREGQTRLWSYDIDLQPAP